jgi:branched-chain amino acid transport system ATP-binding protein
VAVARAQDRRDEAKAVSTLLKVEGLSKRFRGLLAVDHVSFDVERGSIYAVIGPNGAGKTTLFNVIAGVFAPDRGSITFAGERIDRRKPDEICRRGIGRTFQLVRPFPALTVEDNVMIGALLRRHDPVMARWRAHEVLWQLDLFSKRGQVASALTLPDRKRLEVARALATDPSLLGLTILLIEHVMRAVMALAARILVLHHGAAIAEGAPDAVVREPAVVQSYLGAEAVT